MSTLKQAANEFLSHRRIAIAGVSRKGDTAANAIYKKLKHSGYEVYPVNPFAEQIDGDKCFANLESIPGKVEGVVIGTKPEAAKQICFSRILRHQICQTNPFLLRPLPSLL